MDRRDTRPAQAVVQDGLGAPSRRSGPTETGPGAPEAAEASPVTEQVAPTGFAAVPDFVQGQAQSQQAPALRMAQGGDPAPGIMAAQGRQGRTGQEQVPQGSLVPDENSLDRSRGR